MWIDDWAARWNIPAAALFDLRLSMGIDYLPPIPINDPAQVLGSEARQQSLVRAEARHFGVWLTRNNKGVLFDSRGTPVRFGLHNENKDVGKAMRTADLVGMRPIHITQQHVGTVIAQFVSREIKKEGWQYKGDEHERAQLAWCNFVLAKGGDAAFCTGPGTFK